MFKIEQMNKALENACDCKKIFDYYRLVEPFSHDVYDYSPDNELIKINGKCYHIWGRTVPCQNCISKRTCTEKGQFVKIEYLDGKSLLIMSTAVEINQKQYSLELIRDVTNSMTVSNQVSHEQNDITQIIAKFNDLAIHDSFTGLYNKVYIRNEIENYMIYNNDFTVVMIDIDNFKKINDTYGHYFGDKALIMFSEKLEKFAQLNNAKPARVGGDEFLILFSKLNENVVYNLVKEFADDISQMIIQDGVDADFGISFGISKFSEGMNYSEIINLADKEMYVHKKSKKNDKIF